MAGLVVLATGLAAFQMPALAEGYPEQPIRVYVGYPAGTGIDVMARTIGEHFQAATGQPFVVENKVGKGGVLAMQALAGSTPDGYTISVGPGLAASVYLFKSLPFDPVKDFTRVTTLVKVPYFLLVNPKRTPVSSVKELTTFLEKKSGPITFGSPNTPSLVAASLYAEKAGLKTLAVPYKSMTDAMRDLIGGEYDFMFSDSGFALQQMRAGKVRALAVTLPERSSNAPDVPAMAEAGVEGVDFYGWLGVHMPAGVPAATVKRMSGLLNGIMASPPMKKFVKVNGYEPFPGNPEEFTAFEASEFEKWAHLVKIAGIKAR